VILRPVSPVFCPTGPYELTPPSDLSRYTNWTCHQLSHLDEKSIRGQPSIRHSNPIGEQKWPMMSGQRVSRMEGLLNTSAEGQNRSRLVQSGWEGRQIQPKGMIFFLTSLFIENISTLHKPDILILLRHNSLFLNSLFLN
jgi:hypothetical protein